MLCSTIRIALLYALILVLPGLAQPGLPVAAHPAPSPRSGPILTGRNCGSTNLQHATRIQPRALPAAGLSQATQSLPLEIAPLPGSVFAQTEVISAALTLDRRWSASAPVDSSGSKSQFAPSVAFAADGQVYYAWQEIPGRSDGSIIDNGDIYFSVIADPDSQTRRAIRVDDQGTNVNDQSVPVLAITPVGTFVMAWADSRNGRSAIYTAYSPNEGFTWEGHVLVSAVGTPLDHTNPYLLAGDNNTLYLIWEAGTSGQSTIWFAASSDGGQTWSAQTRVNTDVVASQRQQPVLARLSDGSMIAAWSDNRSGTPRIFSARGVSQGTGGWTWSADAPVEVDGTVAQTRPSLAVGNDNIIYLAFEQDTQGVAGVFFTHSTDGGSTWQPAMQLNDGTASAIAPVLAVDGAGEPYCAWCEGRPNRDDVYATRSLDAGRIWTTPVQVHDTTEGEVGSAPQIAVDPAGNAQVVWSDSRGSSPRIFAATWPGGAYADTGSYTSPVYDARRAVTWQSLYWQAVQPTGTGIALELRAGSTATPDATWSDWIVLSATPADISNLPVSRYLQWRATLTSTDATLTPRLEEIRVGNTTLFLPVVLR